MSTEPAVPAEPMPDGGAPGVRVDQRVTDRLLEAVILGLVYFATARAGLHLAVLHPSITPIWPPTGIAIAALLLRGTRAWPGVFAGAFAANLATAGTAWTSLGIAAGNTLEAVAATALVNRYAGGRGAFEHLEDIVRFAVFAGLVSTAISATAGVTSLALGGFAAWPAYARLWVTWWLGDAAGALVVAPLVVLWAGTPRRGWTAAETAERAVFLAALLAASAAVFGSRYPFGFAIVPFLIWAAFRFGARDGITVVAIVAAAAVVGTIHQLGPFAVTTPQPNVSLLYLTAFMAMMALIVLTVGRIVEDRIAAMQELRRRVTAEQVARLTAELAVERTARLAAVTAALSEAVTPQDVAAVIVQHTIRALGPRAAAVSVFADAGATLELVDAHGYPDDVIARWRRFSPSDFGAIEECLRTGQVVALESEADQEHLPDEIRHGACAAVPLVTHGAAVGVLYLNFGSFGRRFTDDEIGFMRTLGHQCAQALERARLYEREHHAAEAFQRALLPASIPQLPGLAIHAVYRPGAREANVGGDWYDVFRLPSGKIAVSVGDVAGRGLGAAVIMGEVRQTIRTAALERDDPATVLEQASHMLAIAHGRETMATAIVAVLDPVSSALSYATAGHPAPLLAVPGGDPVTLPAAGVPLGFLSTPRAPSWTVTLPPGALLVLYTDGLIEQRRDIAAGQDALVRAAQREIAAPSADPARTILREIVGEERAADDVAIVTLALDRTPFEHFEVTLPAEPASAVIVRQSVRRLAHAAALDEQRTAAFAIAVGEAVNNAIEHAYRALPAGGTIHVRGQRDVAALRVSIIDTGQWRPAHAEEDGGHGLRLIEQLADSVDVLQTPGGTTVIVTMRLAPPAVTVAPAAAGRSVPTAARLSAAPAAQPVADATRVVTTPPGPAVPAGPGGARVQSRDGLTVLEAFGDLDATCIDAVRRALATAAEDGAGTVVVSLEQTGYIDSLTIRELFAFGRDLATRRRSLALIVPAGSPLERIIGIAGLSGRFRVFASAAKARAAIKEDGPYG